MAQYARLMDKLRAREYRKASELHKMLFKGARYLLLTVAEKLSLLLELNEPLSKAYILKEDLRTFWNCCDEQQARSHIESWITMAKNSGIRILKKFAKSLQRHIKGSNL